MPRTGLGPAQYRSHSALPFRHSFGEGGNASCPGITCWRERTSCLPAGREPPRDCSHYDPASLKLRRASPNSVLWVRGDSNPQALRHTLLKRTRIPIPPLTHTFLRALPCEAEREAGSTNLYRAPNYVQCFKKEHPGYAYVFFTPVHYVCLVLGRHMPMRTLQYHSTVLHSSTVQCLSMLSQMRLDRQWRATVPVAY